MRITALGARNNININFSNSINFTRNIKPEKEDKKVSDSSFLMKMGQKRAKKIEKLLPRLQIIGTAR